MATTIEAAACSDLGRVRSENQDAYVCDVGAGLFIVADGMGGHVGGRRAADETIRCVVEEFRRTTEAAAESRLENAIRAANTEVWRIASADATLQGMGTTIAAVLIAGDAALIAHVGDSRVYRFRGDTVDALTRDHSYLAELDDRGVDVADPKIRKRYGSVLTRAVGGGEHVDVDVAREPLQPGDVFVICSDGVHRTVPLGEIAERLRDPATNLDVACAAIIAQANEAGGPDNSTVIIVRVNCSSDPS